MGLICSVVEYKGPVFAIFAGLTLLTSAALSFLIYTGTRAVSWEVVTGVLGSLGVVFVAVGAICYRRSFLKAQQELGFAPPLSPHTGRDMTEIISIAT